MTRVLLLKALNDSKYLLLALLLVMLLFPWFNIWVSSQLNAPAFGDFIANALPQRWQRMSAVPFSELATPAGRAALIYIHPIILFGTAVWAIARGSDCISGEIGRGTMEMILAQPVSRTTIYTAHALATCSGALLLSFATWCGTALGIATSSFSETLSVARFVAPTISLFCCTICISGVAAMMSSWDCQRWRTIGLLAAWYQISMIFEIIGRMVDGFEWVSYFSFMTAYSPQEMVAHPSEAWNLLAYHNTAIVGLNYGGQQILLVSLGLLAYVIGALIFNKREIPAPL